MLKLLGRYENFPGVIHGFARFTYRLSRRKLQQTILHTLHQLNREVCGLNEITLLPSSKCEVSFEFGVAEGTTFDYLGEEAMDRIQKSVAKKSLPVLDFLCVVRYHIIKKGKRVALKFDYHILRFLFHRNNAELLVFHERGPRHVSPEDLLRFMVTRINNGLLRNRLKPLAINHLKAL